ncbi:hypothetical protein SCP_0109840 [Sparassis crispa]|uniref:Uncharacterized protein n=1 Tax=Sparassis crispa TaxID=139825 RepID=A0A401G7F7_9APHY|nr:hypothetical protein SCP_0109840 [Sparassis crispa]GBE78102.1 hypothetical protein SCP_0109840 [Sparassis crispa]
MGHIVIIFNLHVPSLYNLSSSDLPLLVSVREISHRLLLSLHEPSFPSDTTYSSFPEPASPLPTPVSSSFLMNHASNATTQEVPRECVRIGFVTPPFKDPKIPVSDHLHAHAYNLPADRMGWWRAIAFNPLAWYAIDDLIAEIREESSNNRIRSGMNARPIDFVPHAGSRKGTASGVETTEPSLGVVDLEGGELTTAARRGGSVHVQ